MEMTRALVLKRICIGAYSVTQTSTHTSRVYLRDENDEVLRDPDTGHALTEDESVTVTEVVEVPFFANPGDVIDISEWPSTRAWLDGGYIAPMPDTVEVTVTPPPPAPPAAPQATTPASGEDSGATSTSDDSPEQVGEDATDVVEEPTEEATTEETPEAEERTNAATETKEENTDNATTQRTGKRGRR